MFDDESFVLVMSNAVLEHDKHFWLTLAEMKRVTRPGGLMVIGVPGFVKHRERDSGRGDQHLPGPLHVRLLPVQHARGP